MVRAGLRSRPGSNGSPGTATEENGLVARPGYSLTEVMMVVAIIGIVAAVGPALLIQANRLFVMSRVRIDLQGEARSVMYVLTRELRQAQNASIVIDQASGQPYYSRISFTKQQGTAMVFYQSGNKLIAKTGAKTQTLTTHLGYMAFTYPRSDDMDILSVSMTVQELIYGGKIKALHMASERVRIMD
ncbi:MAG: prepilin-type N-terminal cleavage/methylation domain-containing protein [Elusimicrobia bacterium]|nr:prepilin-type N-terminal cleavage/methylation domain-containing protein [Elusimicrobiota bacterium]